MTEIIVAKSTENINKDEFKRKLLDMINKGEIKDMIYKKTYTCPYCGYTSDGSDFELVYHEAGSFGLRIFQCPKCGKYIRE